MRSKFSTSENICATKSSSNKRLITHLFTPSTYSEWILSLTTSPFWFYIFFQYYFENGFVVFAFRPFRVSVNHYDRFFQSNLSVLDALVWEQLKEFLHTNAILSEYQSGFRKTHSTISAVMRVVNDIIVTLDKKRHCASLVIDLSKAFDTVDNYILKPRLFQSGLSEIAVAWFSNYLSNRY